MIAAVEIQLPSCANGCTEPVSHINVDAIRSDQTIRTVADENNVHSFKSETSILDSIDEDISSAPEPRTYQATLSLVSPTQWSMCINASTPLSSTLSMATMRRPYPYVKWDYKTTGCSQFLQIRTHNGYFLRELKINTDEKSVFVFTQMY